jgi:DNA-binding response OmpR family regulator
MRVLLIEDDPMIGAGLVQALKDSGHSVDWARDGIEGDLAMAGGGYALILLDLGLPQKSGLSLLEDVRKRGDTTPLVIITARDETAERVGGLDLGADDYLVKPFEVSELMARIRAVLRRNRGHAVSVVGNDRVALDLASHEATVDGVTVLLPAREFALLQTLLARPGAILSRTQIEERIYGWGEEVESNAVDVLIHSIRKKLGKDVIRNVRGAGWRVAGSP